ncbi:hypothetical protein [Streptomyces sp. STCH 565 A]|uniref:hypothetical protein n=1 Tax=Streptomyces sp. STCH 565 A TaxID=2950532 RepID=UPI002074BF22|nr:hypothetical protein [Streptomyces sp. STCH 565 A]MCM8548912.1 hypothetical protein [Streptomyces sp. STCH 565 A]
MTGTTTASLGGLLLAVLVLYANLRPWWAGNREMKLLLPFGKGLAGALAAAACPGGFFGWARQRTGAVANTAGETAGRSATGTAQTETVSSGQMVGLVATGALAAALVVFAVSLAWKAAGKKDRRRIIGGAFVGTVATLTAGIAGALDWLPGTLNGIGDAIKSLVEGTAVL